ncbi:Hypothetical protein FTW_1980 [Francisella tularensis subsp. tularensis WY96-3418]|nr:Hypothetical protein FTW_1980 [Francisella tularensis subsp. tularensis WY96-3418]
MFLQKFFFIDISVNSIEIVTLMYRAINDIKKIIIPAIIYFPEKFISKTSIPTKTNKNAFNNSSMIIQKFVKVRFDSIDTPCCALELPITIPVITIVSGSDTSIFVASQEPKLTKARDIINQSITII